MDTGANEAELAPTTMTSALVAAIDLVQDAVLLLDAQGRVVHANTAARRLPGGPASTQGEDLLARLTPWVDDQVPEQAHALLASGRTWHGTLTDRSTTDTVTLDAAVSAVIELGLVVGYAVVLRDVSLQRRRESELERREADHDAVLSILSQVRPGATVEQTTTALVDAIMTIEWVDGVMVFLLPEHGQLVNVTSSVPAELGWDVGAQVPLERLHELIAVTRAGAWSIDLMTSAAESLFGADLVAAMRATGLRASAYAAIWMHGRVVGVLSVASMRPDAARELAGRLPGIEELGGLAGAVLGAQAMAYTGLEEARRRTRDAIARTAFHTVVQPVVDLATEEIRGYEALTRFDDGRAPDVWFAEAHEAGMGVVLEEACARLAIASARDLPAELALGINLSPSTIRESSVLEALAGAGRPVVIEVTEHAPVDDYDAIRESVAAVPDLGLAVDDAGAGFASLRHILELRPAWVKIDMGLVRDIHRDPARAAIVAGMVHFARLTGTRLVAEGVEVRAEADTLAGLGVELAQGFLFGRPAPP